MDSVKGRHGKCHEKSGYETGAKRGSNPNPTSCSISSRTLRANGWNKSKKPLAIHLAGRLHPSILFSRIPCRKDNGNALGSRTSQLFFRAQTRLSTQRPHTSPLAGTDGRMDLQIEARDPRAGGVPSSPTPHPERHFLTTFSAFDSAPTHVQNLYNSNLVGCGFQLHHMPCAESQHDPPNCNHLPMQRENFD